MRRAVVAVLALIFLNVALHDGSSAGQRPRTVRLLVPTLSGPPDLSANVSTLLAMRLWTTLRKRPTPNPQRLDFGSGEIAWSKRSLDEQSTEYALGAAQGTESDLVLWGFVQKYGSGTLTQSFLTFWPNSTSGTSSHDWLVSYGRHELRLGLPSTNYVFSPLILPDDMVARYSRPDAIHICARKGESCTGITLSPSLFRGERQEGEFALVSQPGGVRGWVFLPDIGDAQGEVIDFTGGMIAYLRRDYERASTMLYKLLKSNASGPLIMDAMVLAAIADSRRTGDATSLVAALKQNPYSRFCVQALIMVHVETMNKTVTADARDSARDSARLLLERYSDLFSPGDPWFVTANQIISNQQKQ
jgi:hypothetical protein